MLYRLHMLTAYKETPWFSPECYLRIFLPDMA